jgi:hypothetical protein
MNMNTVDLAPTSPLVMAELAPAITYRSIEPSSLDPALNAAASPPETTARPALEVHLGHGIDTYM